SLPLRSGRGGRSASADRSGVFGETAEASFPLLEVADRLEQELAVEVRPEDGREPQLRVRDLPQQEVRRAHLAAGADEQIRVGRVGRVETFGDRPVIDLRGLERSGLDLAREL